MKQRLITLMLELDKINSLCWQADEQTIVGWAESEGYPTDGRITEDGKLIMDQVHEMYDTESLAKYAYSMIWDALCFSQENNVPIVLDF